MSTARCVYNLNPAGIIAKGRAIEGQAGQSARQLRGSRRERLPAEDEMYEVAPEMAFYRKYTEGMLRRYVRMSLEMGRVPSLMGKEMFRSKVTSYRMRTFEDVIIFVFDIEKCLAKLDEVSQVLVARVAMQEYTQGEAAGLTGMSLRSVARKYAAALDRLTAIFLEMKLLEPRMESRCQ